jgi:TRAP-type C4-dicarboxylate transport system substrate-binding protein
MTGYAFTFELAVMSKRWFDKLPTDLQAVMLAVAQEVGTEVNPWDIDFLARQRKTWVEQGGGTPTRADLQHVWSR